MGHNCKLKPRVDLKKIIELQFFDYLTRETKTEMLLVFFNQEVKIKSS